MLKRHREPIQGAGRTALFLLLYWEQDVLVDTARKAILTLLIRSFFIIPQRLPQAAGGRLAAGSYWPPDLRSLAMSASAVFSMPSKPLVMPFWREI